MKIDESWKLTWAENRLYYIEAAENVLSRMQAFRKVQSRFPQDVYYTYKPQQKKDLEHKYFKEDAKIDGISAIDKSLIEDVADAATLERVKDIDYRLETMQKESQASLKEIKEQSDKQHQDTLHQMKQQKDQIEELMAILSQTNSSVVQRVSRHSKIKPSNRNQSQPSGS